MDQNRASWNPLVNWLRTSGTTHEATRWSPSQSNSRPLKGSLVQELHSRRVACDKRLY